MGHVPKMVRVEATKHMPGQSEIQSVVIDDPQEADDLFFWAAGGGREDHGSIESVDLEQVPHYEVKFFSEGNVEFGITVRVCEDRFDVEEPDGTWHSDPKGEFWAKLEAKL